VRHFIASACVLLLALSSAMGQALSGGVSGGNVGAEGNGGEVEISLRATDPSAEDPAELSAFVTMEIWMHNEGNQTVTYRQSGLYDGGFPIFEVGGDGEATLVNGYKFDFDTQTHSMEPNKWKVAATAVSLSCFPALNKLIFVRMYFTRPDGTMFAVASKPVSVDDLMTKVQKDSILHPKPTVVPVENVGNVGVALTAGNFSDRGDLPENGSLIPINITVKNNGNQTVGFVTSSNDKGGVPIYKVMSDGQAEHFNGNRSGIGSAEFINLKPGEQYTLHTAWPVSILPAIDTNVFVMLDSRRADEVFFQAASKPQPMGDLMPKKQETTGSGEVKQP